MKKIACLFLALLLPAACFLACSNKSDEKAQQPEQSVEEEENVNKDHPLATITMKNGGVIEIELYPKTAPQSVANFISLANSGYYDGLIFHRVISGFMIQGGDPLGTGTGGPGYSIKGEFSDNGVENGISHVRGVLSMARSKAYDTAGSQFFITHADSTFLDGKYAAFGVVVSGMDVVDEIAAVKTDPDDKPYKDQVIESIRVETYGVDYGEPQKIY